MNRNNRLVGKKISDTFFVWLMIYLIALRSFMNVYSLYVYILEEFDDL